MSQICSRPSPGTANSAPSAVCWTPITAWIAASSAPPAIDGVRRTAPYFELTPHWASNLYIPLLLALEPLLTAELFHYRSYRHVQCSRGVAGRVKRAWESQRVSTMETGRKRRRAKVSLWTLTEQRTSSCVSARRTEAAETDIHRMQSPSPGAPERDASDASRNGWIFIQIIKTVIIYDLKFFISTQSISHKVEKLIYCTQYIGMPAAEKSTSTMRPTALVGAVWP